MDRMLNILSLNKTRVLLIALLIIGIDIGIIHYERELREQPAQQRLLTQEVDSIKALRYQLNHSRGYKIVYLGDSVVYGSSVGVKETLPYYLEQELKKQYPTREIKVFNFGYKGFGFSETFFMLNSLRASGIDMVIFGVSPGWFNRQKSIDNLNVTKLSESVYQENRVKKLGVTLKNNDDWNNSISDFLTEYWALFRNRSNLAAMIVGKSWGETIYNFKLAIYDGESLQKQEKYYQDVRIPWFKKIYEVNELMRQNYPIIGYINLSPNNSQLDYYKFIIELTEQEGIDTFTYTTPLNKQMLRNYNKMNDKLWQENMAQIERLSTSQKNHLVDLSSAVNQEHFADTVHLLARGNKILAQKISREIQQRGIIK